MKDSLSPLSSFAECWAGGQMVDCLQEEVVMTVGQWGEAALDFIN